MDLISCMVNSIVRVIMIVSPTVCIGLGDV